MIPLARPHIDETDINAVTDVLKSGWIAGEGPNGKELEKQFAAYIGTKFALACSNCTAALHMSMIALGIKPGDEVIVPTMTMAATANAPVYCGAKPVLVDIDSKTFNIDVNQVNEKITKKTKAIIPMHYGGQCCDMTELMEVAKDNKLFVVEDVAHAPGAVYKNKKAGSFGDIGCFSFYATKNMTSGEGGMITTNDEQIAKKIKLTKSLAMTKSALDREKTATWFYDIIDLGYNFKLDEMSAALALSQFKKLDKMNARRIEIAKIYDRELKGLAGIATPYTAEHRNHIYYVYVLKILEDAGISRDEFFNQMTQKGIGCSVHFTPVHRLSFFKEKFKYDPKDYPVAEEIYKQIISIPMHPSMTNSEVDTVISAVKTVLNNEV